MDALSSRSAARPSGDADRATAPVTIMFTDVEGSTRKWEAEAANMSIAVARHDRLLTEIVERHGGHVFKTVGDGVCAAFIDPVSAVVAAAAIERAVGVETWPTLAPIRVRIAIHTGVCEQRDGDYFGPTVNRTARLGSIGHGGQSICSAATAALVEGRLPSGITLRDLGAHHLKDIERPEDVSQIDVADLDNEFPRLRSLSGPAKRSNLPSFVTSFVGREDAVEEMTAVLRNGSRLVTVVGPGGAGKTTLSMHVAAELVDAVSDGVWFAELAPLTDPQHVVAAVARVLGIREDPGRDPIEHLVDACAGRAALLVLDNCEHVVDAVAKLADQLLRHCPSMVVIATSREPLLVHGEHVYRIRTLGVPDPGERDLHVIEASAAVQLFVERARLHTSAFTLTPENAITIATVCRGLDGIPLAIELAAGRLGSMSLDTLAERLDKRVMVLAGGARADAPRLRSLRALVDWSWNLLIPAEQVALARLSVFSGHFDVDAAEAVAVEGDRRTLDGAVLVASLVDKSLVQATPDDRYGLLETIRAYAAEQLDELGAVEARDARSRHRDHFRSVAAAAEPHLQGGTDRVHHLCELAAAHDDLVAAIDRSIDDADAAGGLALATALFDYWIATGQFAYAAQALPRLLAAADGTPPALVCRGLADLAAFELRRGNYDRANERAAAAAAMARELDDSVLLARALVFNARTEVGDVTGALTAADEALALARAESVPYLEARALQARAFSLAALDRSDESEQCLEEERAVRARIGDVVGAAFALANLADVDLRRHDPTTARGRLQEALEILGDDDNPMVRALTLVNLGMTELIDGNRSEAAVRFEQSLDVAWRCGLQSDVDYAIFGLALTAPSPAVAAQLHGAVDMLLARRNEQLQPLEVAHRRADRERLETELGVEAFRANEALGAALTRAEAIELALAATRN